MATPLASGDCCQSVRFIRKNRDLPWGDRKDILRWAAAGGKQSQKPVAELDIYRRGGKSSESRPLAGIAARIDPGGTRELEAAGIIDSKFAR